MTFLKNNARPTRSEGTNIAYDRILIRFVDRLTSQGLSEDNASLPINMIDDLRERVAKESLSKATLRQYKAVIVRHIDALHGEEDPERKSLHDALSSIRPVIDKSRPPRTSAKKLKRAPLEDVRRLLMHLDENRNRHGRAKALIVWIRAALLTGLRPKEWQGSKVVAVNRESGTLSLEVINAKNSNGRANGPTRTLHLSRLTQGEIDIVCAQVNIAEATGDGWMRYEHRCCELMRYACRKIWPRREKNLTLYSLRHQVAANIKAAGMSREEVAAIMCHANDVTAGTHYARRVCGDASVVKVGADPKNVSTVRNVVTTFVRKTL